MTYSWLPPLLNDVAEAAGLDAALALARAAGGRRVAIPARAKDRHWLVEAVGRTAADAICALYRTHDADGVEHGAKIIVPLGPTGLMKAAKRQMAQAIADGTSVRAAARLAGLHERTGWKTKARMERAAGGPQASLFDAGLEPPAARGRKPVRG